LRATCWGIRPSATCSCICRTADSDTRYATAYLLHALGSSAELEVTPETDGQRWRPPVEDVLDPVFGRMEIAPMIVVIPDGVCRYGCGQWVDSPVTGNFEQYVLHDVIPYVDGAYRTIADAASRGVSVSPRVGSARGISPRVTRTCSVRWRCCRLIRGST